ncbi:hypothetical protein SRB17_21370 [Streptomyces sp. RB17]|uniref:hypothetical protein n=1 Tax=Streptomyces sp. RB17 TaxID=2585197 RepID=UPI0012961060|nr:hypothetical protein [Streptomyces sp. RB17]MQY34171.1 hypothetical protein [Streptomyces sp. RB17]
MLRERDRILLLCAHSASGTRGFAELAQTAARSARGQLTCSCVLPDGVGPGGVPLPVLRDGRGKFRA